MSTTIVERLVSRASSTPQLTAIVVVPAPPLAPRKAWVTQGGLALGGGRLAAGRGPADRAVERSSRSRARCGAVADVHGKNSFAPARIA